MEKAVSRAADTIRRRWERGVAGDPQTTAAQALADTGQLMSPEVAAELARLRERVAELERERHSTNEALDDAVQELRADRGRDGSLEARAAEFAALHAAGADLVEPMACGVCGIPQRGHGRQWTDEEGWHEWLEPSGGQVLERQQARRARRLAEADPGRRAAWRTIADREPEAGEGS
jgi:DNA repair exonuclease SbcCD ATPase subunit